LAVVAHFDVTNYGIHLVPSHKDVTIRRL